MAQPLVTFPDPIAATLTVLRAVLPDHPDTASVTCGSLQIEDASARGVSLPYLMVDVDSARNPALPLRIAALRIVVWHGEPAAASRIAEVAKAALVAYGGGAGVRSFGSPASGPIPSEDPDSGQPMSYFTIAARLRAEN